MNLRLLWMASFASLLLGLSPSVLDKHLSGDPSGHHATTSQLVGCKIDPEGQCVKRSRPPSSDHGCFMDPNGCKPRPGGGALVEGGSSMDPNGN